MKNNFISKFILFISLFFYYPTIYAIDEKITATEQNTIKFRDKSGDIKKQSQISYYDGFNKMKTDLFTMKDQQEYQNYLEQTFYKNNHKTVDYKREFNFITKKQINLNDFKDDGRIHLNQLYHQIPKQPINTNQSYLKNVNKLKNEGQEFISV